LATTDEEEKRIGLLSEEVFIALAEISPEGGE
jgi:hypothetical protein